MIIRSETFDDQSAAATLVQAAFRDVEHSSQTEAAIIDALRQAGALSLSLVAEDEGSVIGHAAFSPCSSTVRIWAGLVLVQLQSARTAKARAWAPR